MLEGTGIDFGAILWFASIVLFFIIEGMTFSLVCIWFAGGSIAALVTSLLGFGAAVQFSAFVVVSAILLALVRPMAKRYATSRKTRTNADRVIGNVGVVIKQIDPLKNEGQIRVLGQIWSAKPEDGSSVIAADSHVEVMAISGVKVVVREAAPK